MKKNRKSRSISKAQALKLARNLAAFWIRSDVTLPALAQLLGVGNGTISRVMAAVPCDKRIAARIRRRMEA